MRSQVSIRALVIGIDHFQSRENTPLKKAVADAKDVAEVLRRFGGPDKVRALLGAEATRDAVFHAIDALKALPRESRAQESLVVFVATHGVILGNSSPTYLLW